ncbi:MAG: ABC transporter permease, partial [Rhodoferax sp.]
MHSIRRYLPAIWVFVGFAVLWQLAVSVLGIREYLLPSPIQVFRALTNGEIDWASQIWVTGVEI